MKKFTFLLLLTLSFSFTKAHAQDSKATSADRWEKLYGYWYFERANTNNPIDEPKHPYIQKLYFSKDSIMISNFGSRAISAMASSWTCDIGTWNAVGDTIHVTYIRTVAFHTNIGKYYQYSRPLEAIAYTFLIKKIDSEELVADMILRKNVVRISTEHSNEQLFVSDQRTYKKVPTQVMK